MFQFDLPLNELKKLRLAHTSQPDFDDFWEQIKQESKDQPLEPEGEGVDYPVSELQVEKVSYAAFDGGRVVGWSVTPVKIQPRGTLIFFHGYTSTRGPVADYLLWALQGFTCLAFDVRGQTGESVDTAAYPAGQAPGWLTKGILEPRRYYLVRCYADALRALDFAATRPEVDAERMGITGVSQGGALALAASSLDHRLKLCMAEVPAFCHVGRCLELSTEFPWTELTHYFRKHPERLEEGLRTLSYIEVNNMTEHIFCPTLISVGLQDMICVPSSIFSAYNHLHVGERELKVFPFGVHQGGDMIETMVLWARKHLLAPAAA